MEPKNKHAVALGKLGGLKGGPARAQKLTSERRTEIARLAANKRWEKRESEGGFEDIPENELWLEKKLRPCLDPSHKPPGMMVIPAGKQYRHVCPSCGHTVVLRNTFHYGM